MRHTPDSKVHGVLSAPHGPHVGPMNLALRHCQCGLSLWWNYNAAIGLIGILDPTTPFAWLCYRRDTILFPGTRLNCTLRISHMASLWWLFCFAILVSDVGSLFPPNLSNNISIICSHGSFYLDGLKKTGAWVNKHICCFMWDISTYRWSNVNSCFVKYKHSDSKVG